MLSSTGKGNAFPNYFEAIFTNTKENTIIMMDEQGLILKVNSAFTNYFGYTDDDIVGQHLSTLFTPADQRLGLPEKELKKVMSEGQASDNNFLVDKNMNRVWVSGESILVKGPEATNIILKIIQNINTLKISESAVIRLNDFNESILVAIEDMVLVLNDKLEIIKVNPSFLKLFNYEEPAIDGLNFLEVIRKYSFGEELYAKILHVLSTGEGFSKYDLEIPGTSGEKKAFEISSRVIYHSGADKHVLLTAHDITTSKQAEKEREDIIGFVAHELRNPLANVVLCNEMMTQLLADNEVSELEEYLQRSKNNVMRLNKMIGELYDATKFNSGNFNLEKVTFDFEEMVEEALDTLEVLHPDYSIIVEGECAQPVYGDRYRLIQVVTNFLSNGIKYSNNNTKVVIAIAQDDTNVTVSVKDEGLGISAKQLPHIFGRFFRAERTKNLEGIGLGLYLCRRIIEAHEGRVWAESEEGHGSTFYFSIPFKNRAVAGKTRQNLISNEKGRESSGDQ